MEILTNEAVDHLLKDKRRAMIRLSEIERTGSINQADIISLRLILTSIDFLLEELGKVKSPSPSCPRNYLDEDYQPVFKFRVGDDVEIDTDDPKKRECGIVWDMLVVDGYPQYQIAIDIWTDRDSRMSCREERMTLFNGPVIDRSSYSSPIDIMRTRPQRFRIGDKARIIEPGSSYYDKDCVIISLPPIYTMDNSEKRYYEVNIYSEGETESIAEEHLLLRYGCDAFVEECEFLIGDIVTPRYGLLRGKEMVIVKQIVGFTEVSYEVIYQGIRHTVKGSDLNPVTHK